MDPSDETFWRKFWSEWSVTSGNDVFSSVSAAQIRALRETVPGNLGTLIYKTVTRLTAAADTSVSTQAEQNEGWLNFCDFKIFTVLCFIFYEF